MTINLGAREGGSKHLRGYCAGVDDIGHNMGFYKGKLKEEIR